MPDPEQRYPAMSPEDLRREREAAAERRAVRRSARDGGTRAWLVWEAVLAGLSFFVACGS